MSSARRRFRPEEGQTMPGHLLEIDDLHKSFGDVEVLKGVDFAMNKGDVVSIIGSSGSGKTTLLRCINMLEDFQGGSIRIDGEEIGYETVGGQRRRKPEKEIARQRALTGMAFQQFNLFPHMSALDNVMLGLLKVKKMPKDGGARRGDEMAGPGRAGRPRRPLSRPAFGRPAAARRHRARHRHEPAADAVRRGHLGARPRAGQRGASGDPRPRRRTA